MEDLRCMAQSGQIEHPFSTREVGLLDIRVDRFNLLVIPDGIDCQALWVFSA
jgi:hypothetical protein